MPSKILAAVGQDIDRFLTQEALFRSLKDSLTNEKDGRRLLLHGARSFVFERDAVGISDSVVSFHNGPEDDQLWDVLELGLCKKTQLNASRDKFLEVR